MAEVTIREHTKRPPRRVPRRALVDIGLLNDIIDVNSLEALTREHERRNREFRGRAAGFGIGFTVRNVDQPDLDEMTENGTILTGFDLTGEVGLVEPDDAIMFPRVRIPRLSVTKL